MTTEMKLTKPPDCWCIETKATSRKDITQRACTHKWKEGVITVDGQRIEGEVKQFGLLGSNPPSEMWLLKLTVG